MQQILDRYQTGVQVSTVAIQNVQPPEQVQAAFDDAVKAGQDRERQINEGQAYAKCRTAGQWSGLAHDRTGRRLQGQGRGRCAR